MNFLAHYLLATEYLTPPGPRAAYAVGSALPDLLPIAAPKKRLRLAALAASPRLTWEEQAIWEGVRAHLATDAVFHRTDAFEETQTRVGEVITRAGFVGIRVRRFFLGHVLTELALDAVLLRRQPRLADDFYRDFSAADHVAVARWAEATVGQPLPRMTDVLTQFADARYLASYAENAGVAEGLLRLSLQARQDPFQGDNRRRLAWVVHEAVTLLGQRADLLLAETAAVLPTPPG